jgi:hypothetical protein
MQALVPKEKDFKVGHLVVKHGRYLKEVIACIPGRIVCWKSSGGVRGDIHRPYCHLSCLLVICQMALPFLCMRRRMAATSQSCYKN